MAVVTKVGESRIGNVTNCLQCGRMVLPDATLSIAVMERGKFVGYLHLMGTCKKEWDEAHPSPETA